MFTVAHRQFRGQTIDIGRLRRLEESLRKAGMMITEPFIASPFVAPGPAPEMPMPPVEAGPPPREPIGPTMLGGGFMRRENITLAAKSLREDLARAFPQAKFCVTIERYSMGSSINVNWVDGPSTAAVDKIADKYAAVDYDPIAQEILSGGNRHVSTQRRYSPGRFDAAKAEYERTHSGYEHYQPQEEAWRFLSRTEFYPQPAFKCVRGIPMSPGGEFF